MLKPFVDNRIIFHPISKQGQFIKRAKNKLNLSWIELANILKLHPRTVRDWARNKKRMSFVAAKLLSRKSKIKLQNNISKLTWRDHTINAGKIGGKNNFIINTQIGGNLEYRKKRWLEWWKSEGQFIEDSITKPLYVKLPKTSVDLAEFVGILMGDGGITQFCVSIYLNSETDKKYIKFVSDFIKKLFNVTPKIYPTKKKCIVIAIQRKKIVDFCIKIGLKMGNKLKQNIDIPDWIKNDKIFLKACIRGLIDTDGCFFRHRYKVGKNYYEYNKIVFTSRSPTLIQSVKNSLNHLGIKVRITKDGNDIRIERKNDVQRYKKIIGTHNLKHLKRHASVV